MDRVQADARWGPYPHGTEATVSAAQGVLFLPPVKDSDGPSLLDGKRDDLGHAWHEFVAYVVQFEAMDADMRRGILDQFASLEGFASPANVNAITLSFDPALFGLRAYLFARDQGGRDFAARVISGDVDFATEEGGPMHP
ncbi:hypothetical protein IC608_07685 [Devosia sp. PTR5]|uniref:Uncharacterized protein n=1 Tax=Devosia oryzisoli TaxID=2774138 RepID=A0A927FU10_9HYPH|nr:hypothetical protein [Devosia oryzisoli]MBD8065352.1 hypothetical protein [Devosia oryzisoli]